MSGKTPSKQDMARATKYIAVLAGAIMVVGASSYLILPFAYENVKPAYPEVYMLIIYYPMYGMVVIAVAGYYWIKYDNKRQGTQATTTRQLPED